MIKTFPYLEVKGTNYQVGTAIGEMFRGKIQEIIEDRKHYIRKYLDKLELTKPYFDAAKRAFPKLVDEMQGMADGAQVPLPDLFFHNTPEVYDNSPNWDRQQVATADHCTSVVSFTKETALIGHNEDWSIKSLDELYVLKATIEDTTLIGLNYASFIIGESVSLNNWGLVQCVNDLRQINGIGVPCFFIDRALAECQSFDHTEQLIRRIQHASGCNHLLVQKNHVCDIEITHTDIDVEKLTEQPYVHTNHHISKHTKTSEHHASKSSLARYDRAKKLVRNDMTFEDMQTLLSDKENTLYPICRENITIASVIIELEKRIMHVCYGEPCKGVYVPYRL